MSFIVHAPNVHQGGGRALLSPLLEALHSKPCIVLLDARFNIPWLPSCVRVLRFKPTLVGRLAAEMRLSQLASPQDTVLCFGNLPPLLANSGRIYVFLQNRLLFGSRDFSGFPFRVRVRCALERIWLWQRLKKGTKIIVQTASMARELEAVTGRSSLVLPFLGVSKIDWTVDDQKRYDFIYVASGEPHKNHQRLIKAWKILEREGITPSLCLTLDEKACYGLSAWISRVVCGSELRIENVGHLSPKKLAQHYSNSSALIYPSILESFGLPLLEAAGMGIPIIASELDYVRDVVIPIHTFDPYSEVSIARAVKRFLGLSEVGVRPITAAAFIDALAE